MIELDRDLVFGFLAAIGGGLLVGTERERNKGEGPQRGAIGIRTCTLAALLGAVAALLGPPALFAAGIGVVALTLAGYWRQREFDPGLTTELALQVTFVLGALAMQQARLAAALFAGLTIVLASKSALHAFVRQRLSERELGDALLLAASALIVMPLLPDRAVDPFGVINPRRLWLVAVLVMSINAAGYVALRALGPRRGLALSGLFGGFVSSAATIAGMAHRARTHPALRSQCASGALLSNVATVAQLALVLLAVAPELLRRLAMPLALAGVAAAVIGGLSLRKAYEDVRDEEIPPQGRAFSLRHALLFAAIVAAALIASAILRQSLGSSGVFAAAAVAGLADVHAAAVAVGQLVSAGGLATGEASLAVALAFTANSLVKCLASLSGGSGFAASVIGGIALLNAILLTSLWLLRSGAGG